MEEKKICKKIDFSKNKISPRVFFLEKLNALNPKKKLIKSKISEFFCSPDNYFEPTSKILINKKIIIKKISSLGEMGQSMKNNLNKSASYKEKMISNANYNKESTKEKYFLNKNFETINNEKLKDIFESYKRRRRTLKKKILINKNHNSYDKSIPIQLSVDLDSQLHLLNQNIKAENKSRQMSKYLARKIKKNEKCLLINNIYSYHNKKQILNNDSKNDNNFNSNNNESSLFKWIFSLRRPRNFQGKRETYINVGNQNNPLWSTAIERCPDDKEITIKSKDNSEPKENNGFIQNDQFKRVESLEQINIRGKKLYDIEYNREMSSDSRKILHKSFVDNGKVIMYKDVNNIFGYETIYKNYLGRNKKNNNRNNITRSQSMISIYPNNNGSKY